MKNIMAPFVHCGGQQILALGLAFLGAGFFSTAGADRPWPSSSGQIVVFADQLPEGMSEAQRSFAATHLAGTQKMRLSEIRALRAYNADFLCLHYQLALGCGAHDFVVGDAWTSDWSYVTSQEDWFLHNASDERVHQAVWDWDIMNITSTDGVFQTGFPQYWLTTCLQRIAANEDDGVFADSFTIDGYFDQCNPSHPWFQDVNACLTNWIPNLDYYGAAIKSSFEADGRGYLFLPNLGGLITSWDTTNYRVGHGGMIECFCFWGGNDYFDLADWQLQMDRAVALIHDNAVIICQSYIGDYDNTNDRLFAVSAYLLIKGNYTYISMLVGDGLEYYPEYTINLGEALGTYPSQLSDLWSDAWQVYRRDYANGLVLVNPGESAVAINLPGTNYRQVAVSGGGAVNEAGEYSGTLSYNAVTSLTLSAHAGTILLTSSAGTGRTPMAGDFDGDQLTDLALYKDSFAAWSLLLSSSGYQRMQLTGFLGGTNWTAVAGDADGDGRSDPAVYESSSGSWSVRLSSAGYAVWSLPDFLGGTGTVAVLADFDGDSYADPAVCNPTTGHWLVKLSASGYNQVVLNGFPDGADWIPLAGDFDGDWLADPAACHPASGNWAVLLSSTGYQRVDVSGLLGGTGALPVAGDFDNDGLSDPGLYFPATGAWTLLFSSIGYQPIHVSAWESP